MSELDQLLERLRRQLSLDRDDEKVVNIRIGSLRRLLKRIDELSALPEENTPGKMHRDPNEAEKLAALQVLPRTGTQRIKCLRALVEAGDDGLTDEELAATCGIYLYSAAPRRTELVTGGWVTNTGRTRPTARTFEATVWKATPKAFALRADIIANGKK